MERYADLHGLSLNPSKTVCWHSRHTIHPEVYFAGHALPVLDEAVHLGHVLTNNLSDVLVKTKDMIRKANSILCSFKNLSPECITFLFRAYCLSFMEVISGICLTSSLETGFNKILHVFGTCLLIPTLGLFTEQLNYRVFTMLFVVLCVCLCVCLSVTIANQNSFLWPP